jgi:catalase-peroxidase
MTVLVGGMRVLGANTAAPSTASSPTGPALTNDFFVNLLDMGTEWKRRRRGRRRGVRGP